MEDYSTGANRPLRFFSCLREGKRCIFVSQANSDAVATLTMARRQFEMLEKLFECECHKEIIYVLMDEFQDEVWFNQFFYGGKRLERTIRFWARWGIPEFLSEHLEARINPLMPPFCYACHKRRSVKDGKCAYCQAVNVNQVVEVKEKAKKEWKTNKGTMYLPKVWKPPVYHKKKYRKKKDSRFTL